MTTTTGTQTSQTRRRRNRKRPRNKQKHQALARYEQSVARSHEEIQKLSKQPSAINQFAEGGEWAKTFFNQFYSMATQYHKKCPPYGQDWKRRNDFLSYTWLTDPYWSGSVKTVCSIDANRGWTLIGPHRQLAGYRRSDGYYPGANEVMHNHFVAADVVGYYDGVFEAARNYRTTDIGHVNEILRLGGEDGPAVGFSAMDPTQCELTGNYSHPLRYSEQGQTQMWHPHDYFRVSDMPSRVGGNPGYGYCATSMMLEVIKIMVAVTAYKNERLGAKLPLGFLTVQGMSDEQFASAMGGKKGMMKAKNRKWFGGLAVLCQPDKPIELKLTALSQIPDGFNEQDFVDAYMSLSALILGVDRGELWPTTGGSFGRSNEAQIQYEQASNKGKKSFIVRYFEQLQRELPRTVSLISDERDDKGELVAAQVKQAKADAINAMWQSGLGYISQEEARSLAAEQELIPREWTEMEEEATATDTEQIRVRQLQDRCRTDSRILRAAAMMPSEPIVSVHYPSGVVTQLYERADDVLRARLHPVPQRQSQGLVSADSPTLPPTINREVLFQQGNVVIDDEDVDAMQAQTEAWAAQGLVDELLPDLLEAESVE